MRKILLLLVMFVLVGCSNNENVYKSITYVEAQELISNSEVILIDVRTNNEYELYHIDGAINIPLDTISKSSGLSLDIVKGIINNSEEN